MGCSSCASANLTKFTSETMIHPTGFKNAANPGILVFPKLLVCFVLPFQRPSYVNLEKAERCSRSNARSPRANG